MDEIDCQKFLYHIENDSRYEVVGSEEEAREKGRSWLKKWLEYELRMFNSYVFKNDRLTKYLIKFSTDDCSIAAIINRP